jgi:hypothetical protein
MNRKLIRTLSVIMAVVVIAGMLALLLAPLF